MVSVRFDVLVWKFTRNIFKPSRRRVTGATTDENAAKLFFWPFIASANFSEEAPAVDTHIFPHLIPLKLVCFFFLCQGRIARAPTSRWVMHRQALCHQKFFLSHSFLNWNSILLLIFSLVQSLHCITSDINTIEIRFRVWSPVNLLFRTFHLTETEHTSSLQTGTCASQQSFATSYSLLFYIPTVNL